MKGMFWIITISMISLLIPTNAGFAQTADDVLKEHLAIQTIWVTANKSCYNYDINRLDEYQRDLILPYLQDYGLEPFTYPIQCMSKSEYDHFEPLDYTDLLIVIYNKNIGREILHENNMAGYFSEDEFSKSGLRIEICDCPTFEYKETTWVISHELSHFALFYLGFPQDVWLDWVHDIQEQYDEFCPIGNTDHPKCEGLWTEFFGENRDFQVMTIYPEAYERKPPQTKFVNYLESDFDVLIDESPLSERQIKFFNNRIFETSHSLVEIESGLIKSHEAINSVYDKYESEKAREHVAKAFSAYMKLKNEHEKQSELLEKIGDQFFSSQLEENYQNVPEDIYDVLTADLNQVNSQLVEIGSEMNYISQELDFASKAQAQFNLLNVPREEKPVELTCFLLWCF